MMDAPEHECEKRDENPISLAQVLVEEFAAIHRVEPHTFNPAETDEAKKLKAIIQDLHKQKPAGLCLSGGGIRSATFALGILQGLARCELLDKFHYLSTVSGGGYIGSWLTAWIHQVTNAENGCASADSQWDSKREQALGAVISRLHNVQKDDPTYPEASPIRHLRQYSNYLSPKLGFLSADTWTLVAIYLRNLMVNWLVLVPLSLALLAIPRLSAAIVAIPSCAIPPGWLYGLLVVGCILFVVALTYMAFNLPRINTEEQLGKIRRWLRSAGQGAFLLCCLMPLILSAAISTTWFAWFCHSWAGKPELYASFATPAVLTAILLVLTLFILVTSWIFGIGKLKVSDIDLWLEWCARSGAWIIIAIVSWAALSTLVLFGPCLIPRGWKYISAAGSISGLITVLLGASAKTTPKPQGPTDKGGVGSLLISKAPQLAAPLFAAFLVVLISVGTGALLRNYLATDVIAGEPGHVAYFALMICGLGGLGCIFSMIVNVNIFSMHGMYRDRLIRAYLGASRPDGQRKPHPFTGFDPKDNIAMHCLWRRKSAEALPQPIPEAVRSRALFPVVNITLNLVHGKNLAWQERKAESFTVTPLHCGSWAIGRRNPQPEQRKGYRRTYVADPKADETSHTGYADGITLGTAVAISGAAASPNMGYHSSPLVTLLMTLFNVRLGWWLGNPGPTRGTEIYKRWFPKFGIKPILAEAFGLTNDENKYIYLSDGGHFENLGLYEMVLRRCHYIVVSDAGQDADCKFVDLGEAVRKIRIDLGIPIEFDEMFIYARSDDPVRNKAGRRCAIGYIKYSAVDGDGVEDGVLIYIKPACYGYEPRDVYEYYKRSALFPHESTVNQFFTESQFESYRMLGVYTMQQLCGDEKLEGFKQFRRKIERYLK